MPESTLVHAEAICKYYEQGDLRSVALDQVDLDIHSGEFTAIVGPSGSGKTTLLNCIGALDDVSAGSLRVLDRDIASMSRDERSAMRLRELGFIFQSYNLLPVLTAVENVEFLLELQGVEHKERRQRAMKVLQRLGLIDYAERRPDQLSGGQQQRIAVARAVVSRPRLVLADEPTANLDGSNTESLIAMMQDLRKEDGITFVFSTHDQRVIKHAERVITLEDGRVVSDEQK